MTPAERDYQCAGLRLRVARAQLLRQIARDGVALADLLQFARVVGDDTQADSVPAFRAAMAAKLQLAQVELDRLENGNGQVSPRPRRRVLAHPGAS